MKERAARIIACMNTTHGDIVNKFQENAFVYFHKDVVGAVYM
jgi:hypothetical protein